MRFMTTIDDKISASFNRAITLHEAGQFAAALSLYDEIVAVYGKHPVVFYNRGLVLQDLRQFEAAIASYERAIALHPRYAEAYSNRGDALHALGHLTEAVTSYDHAIALKSDVAEIYSNRGATLQKLGELDAAIADYDRAIALKPNYAEAYSNRGSALHARGEPEAAIRSYTAAIGSDANLFDAYNKRALALMELGKSAEALADFGKVDVSHPAYAHAKINTFALRLSLLEEWPLIEDAGAEASRIIVKRSCDNLSVQKSLMDFHILHDIEQTSYLIDQGYETPGLQNAHDQLKRIYARRSLSSAVSSPIQITDEEIISINSFRQTRLRYQGALVVSSCLNPDNDWAALEGQYFSTEPETIVIDNFLSLTALAELRKFCLVSGVYHKAYDREYVGAFAEGGFISPLHCQIAHELRARMPRIFGEHRLGHIWSFKCMSQTHTGLKVHADFAKVNLNFWLTPDEANLDPMTGGLIVHDVAAPTDWNFRDYNNNEERIYKFLRDNNARKKRIPYRCNRAVLFNSSLFHETDQFNFRDGYENRRINVTYLFGKGLRTH